MILKFAIQTVLEIAVVVLIIYGFIREDKLIAFEDCASDGWDGKCCAYTYITDRFREIPATDDCCAYYLKKKGARM